MRFIFSFFYSNVSKCCKRFDDNQRSVNKYTASCRDIFATKNRLQGYYRYSVFMYQYVFLVIHHCLSLGFEIVTKAGLNYDSATSYTVDVSCTDGQNTDVTGSHTVTLSDQV